MAENRFFNWAISSALLTGATSPVVSASTPNQAKIVTIYSGEVNEETAERFVTLISENTDKVIGLRVLIEPSRDGDSERSGYSASYDDRQLVVSQIDPNFNGGGIEIVKNGDVHRTWAHYSLDGFYIVKAGGMAQGILSFALEPVDEAVVRLNPAVRLSEQKF